MNDKRKELISLAARQAYIKAVGLKVSLQLLVGIINEGRTAEAQRALHDLERIISNLKNCDLNGGFPG